MSTLEILLIFAASLLLALCVVLVIKNIITHKSVKKLSAEIDEYLKSGKKIIFDTKDNSFSLLHNNVSDLCDALEIQKQNNEKDNVKNARFVADVSHQLKTPLAGLRLYCEMEQSKNPTDNGEKQLELLGKTEKLVYNILRLQKLKADAYEMNFKENSLGKIAEETAEQFRTLYPEKQIEVIGNAVFRCDGEWLSEALGNIIKNACEHTAPDGKILIKTDRTETSVTLVIEDNGGGVLEEELPKLFERFYKSKNSSSESTGIGLAITKEITEKHHGIIFAENTDVGLKITMCFPVIDCAQKM